MYGADTRRSSREDEVAGLEREILTDISHDVIHRAQHVARISLLHRLAVDVKMETEALDVWQQVFRHPLADGRGPVETLGEIPRLSVLREPLLQLTCREVDTKRHGVIVTMGEAHRHGLAKLAHTHHDLCLIVDTSEVVGDEERLPVLLKARVSLQEDNRLVYFQQRIFQLFIVLGIVHPHAEYLHSNGFVIHPKNTPMRKSLGGFVCMNPFNGRTYFVAKIV